MMEFTSLEELISRREQKEAQREKSAVCRALAALLPRIDVFIEKFLILEKRRALPERPLRGPVLYRESA